MNDRFKKTSMGFLSSLNSQLSTLNLSVKKGITLVEVMVAMSILSIGVLGMIGSFTYLNKGLQVTKGRTLANNLAQEKIELLKDRSYYHIIVTTATHTDTTFTPPITYDTHPNGVENISVGGINFERRIYIRKVAENVSGNLTPLAWDHPDTGLKEISVYVLWKEGDEWKKIELANIRQNPDRSYLSAAFKGVVDDSVTSAMIEGVKIKALENPARADLSGAVGDYSFAIEPGSYTLRASKQGYFTALSDCISIEASQVLTKNFTLTKMSTGTISGSVYKNDHLVISQVVGSTVDASNANFDQEYIELYNPTTYFIRIVNGWNTMDINLKMQWHSDVSSTTIMLEGYAVIDTGVQPHGYFLIANTGTVVAAGVTRVADAVYSSAYPLPHDFIKVGGSCDADAVGIAWANDSWIDIVGWNKNSGINTPEIMEGDAIDQGAGGFDIDEQFVRRTSSGGINPGFGRAYDSNNNNTDFVVKKPFIYPPRNSSDVENAISGASVGGAIAYADDGISNSVVVDSSGNFTLVDVATGSWTVYISSGMNFISSGTFGGTTHGFAASMNVFLTSTTTLGYISGTVTDIFGSPIGGIEVYAGGAQNATNLNGGYVLAIEPDTVVVTANYQLSNSQYIEVSSMNVIVTTGQMVKNVDFTLIEGGNIRGRVITISGVDPLPNTPIVAFKSGAAQGDGISDENGYFYMNGISSGTYGIEPQLEAGESSNPSSHTVVLAASGDIFIGTFTVSGAMGYIEGNVLSGGEAIDTGVLIYASTATIAANPPMINSSLCSGSIIYYAVSSNFDGTYRLPVRGGYTYNIYAWYTTWSGDTPNTVRKEYEVLNAFAVAAAQTVTKDFSW